MKQDAPRKSLSTTAVQSSTSNDLLSALAEHERWLRTNGAEGRRASLDKADFRHVDLSDRNLSRANLSNASFKNVNLSHANLASAHLGGADLSGANLNGADLTEVVLVKANLSGANFSASMLDRANVFGAVGIEALLQPGLDLSKTKGILARDLARRDLSGLILPEGLSGFKGVDQTAEICKLSQTILLAVVGACFYSWLTIATTTDVMFVSSSTPTTLPIIQTSVSTVGFYFAMPILLFAVGIYFHMYVQRLWDVLGSLPAVFPDGRTIDETTYPWMLTSLVSPHLTTPHYRRPQYWRLQFIVSVILAWIIIPFTLGLFWLRYLSRHEALGTALHVTLLATAVISTIVFYRRAITTLDGRVPPMDVARSLLRVTTGPFVLCVFVLLIVLGLFSEAAINGERVWYYQPWSWRPQSILPQMLESVGLPPFLTIREAKISQVVSGKPAAVISLIGRDLRQADAEGVFLQGANLMQARLDGAHFDLAHLDRAYMLGASLLGASLDRASLSDAMLVNVKSSKVNMSGVRLTGADAELIDLTGAQLGCHRISNEAPECADVQRATLRRAMLDNSNLEGANLSNSDLRAASLRNAHLEGTRLSDADFRCDTEAIIGERQCTDIRGANLSEAIGLTSDQLKEACGDKTTLLPPNFPPVRICTDAEFIRQPPPK
jgi:uncharacterized protein YjbI with pentapeptide repeats